MSTRSTPAVTCTHWVPSCTRCFPGGRPTGAPARRTSSSRSDAGRRFPCSEASAATRPSPSEPARPHPLPQRKACRCRRRWWLHVSVPWPGHGRTALRAPPSLRRSCRPWRFATGQNTVLPKRRARTPPVPRPSFASIWRPCQPVIQGVPVCSPTSKVTGRSPWSPTRQGQRSCCTAMRCTTAGW